MAERRVSVRLAAVDGDRLKAELINIGREGKEALNAIADAAKPASGGLDRVDTASGSALRQLDALADRASRAAASLRAAGVSTGTVVDRVNQLTGVSGRVRRGAEDIEAYGAALDRLRARHNPLFAVIQQYRQQLSEIREAHRVGAITADEMTTAIQRERQATLSSIAAIKGRTTALTEMNATGRLATWQMRNLQFQLIDIAQGIPLAFVSPLYGLQNFAFQGAQIAQIYSGQPGGVAAALRDSAAMVGRFAARLAPVAVPAAAVGAAIAGMTHEINAAQDVTVSFGDTALATWQVIADGVETILRPAIDAIAPYVASAWGLIVDGVKIAGNTVINSWRVVFESIKSVWDTLPTIIGVAVTNAANATISALESMVNRAIELLNGLADRANEVLSRIPGLSEDARIGRLEPVSIGRLEGPDDSDLAERRARRIARIMEIIRSDPMGGFFDAVQQRAIANALAPTEEELKKMADAMERLRQEGESVRRSVRTAAEEYAETMERLKMLQDAGVISMETYGRAAEQAAEKLRQLEEQERKRRLAAASDPLSGAIRALENYAERAGDIADTIEGGISRAFQGAEDAVAQFVSKGKVDFASLVSSIITDLARLAIRQAVLGPLASSLSGALGGIFGGAGLFGAGGTADSSLGLQSGTMVAHAGAVAGGAASERRNVPAALFMGAERFHRGGVAGLRADEVPAILQRGERVLNRRQSREWESSRGVTVNIMARDAESFRQSRTQVAADIARAVAFGGRGM